jgi:hypothetical protein
MTPGKMKRKERRARAREAQAILRALGLTPKELGPRIRVSWRTIYRWGSGAVPHSRAMKALRKYAARKEKAHG